MRLPSWHRHGSGDDTRPVSAGVEVLMNRLACVALGLLVVLPVSAGAQGQKVFEAQKCSLCHSVAGKGNTKGALDDVGSKYSAADLKLWLTKPEAMAKKHNATRKPPMKSYASLPAEDIDVLVAYLQTLKKK
jgi:mono/diheme cytochrome c family protein